MISFDLADACHLLSRTPSAITEAVSSLPDPWRHATDGPGTWSAHDVLAHLIDGEHVDWLPRLRTILDHGEACPFSPFNREGFREIAESNSTEQLLEQFASIRATNVMELQALELTRSDLERTGVHPEFGRVTVRQLLATWVAHDHGHLVQIHRTLARQYAHEVGPWTAYLSVFRRIRE